MNFLLLNALDVTFCFVCNQTGTIHKTKNSLDVKMSRFLGIPL